MIPFLELRRLLAVEQAAWASDFVPAFSAAEKSIQRILGGAFDRGNAPDWLFVKMVRRYVITQNAYEEIDASPDEIAVNGVLGGGDIPGSQNNFADLALCGPASLPGMILGELTRRLEVAIAQDRAQERVLGWEPPEPWGGGIDDSTSTDGWRSPV